MGGNDYTEIRIDTSSVRGYAEKMYAERLHNFQPNIDRIREDLTSTNSSTEDLGVTTASPGYLFGRSAMHHTGGTLAAIHDSHAQTTANILDQVSLGFLAIANAAACVAETAKTTDELAALDVIDATAAFGTGVPITTEPDNYGHPEDAGSTPTSSVF